MARKTRLMIDLPKELKEWLDRESFRLSHERGERVSRNMLIEEMIHFYMKENNIKTYVKLTGYGHDWDLEFMYGDFEPSRTEEPDGTITVIGEFIPKELGGKSGFVFDIEDGCFAVIQDGEFIEWRDSSLWDKRWDHLLDS